MFDLSYIPWRNVYLRYLPTLTKLYDPYKGIEPHRDTEKYLNTVDTLETQIKQTGINSAEVENLLKQLRDQSAQMIDNNPFQLANKSGTLEKIKNLMRSHIFRQRNVSAKESFRIFWSAQHLAEPNTDKELGFFDQKIRFLIATNYYRHFSENGQFINIFWQIDIWFNCLFLAEFLLRTWVISRRYKNLKWRGAMLGRSYDILLVIPFSLLGFNQFALCRIITVIVRLHQAELPDLEPLRAEISKYLVSVLATEITEVVVVNVINQTQESIKSGDLIKMLFKSSNNHHVNLNNVNEIEAIANYLVQLIVYDVMPTIQPDLEALLHHNINNLFNQSPVTKGIQNIPGFNNLSSELAQQLATEITKALTVGPQDFYQNFINIPKDTVGEELTNRLFQHLSQSLAVELQKKHTVKKIETLILDILEEVKVSYVKFSIEEKNEQAKAEDNLLQKITSANN